MWDNDLWHCTEWGFYQLQKLLQHQLCPLCLLFVRDKGHPCRNTDSSFRYGMRAVTERLQRLVGVLAAEVEEGKRMSWKSVAATRRVSAMGCAAPARWYPVSVRGEGSRVVLLSVPPAPHHLLNRQSLAAPNTAVFPLIAWRWGGGGSPGGLCLWLTEELPGFRVVLA